MDKIIWHHYNDTPNRRLYIANYSNKTYTIQVQGDVEHREPYTRFEIIPKQKVNYPVDVACNLAVQVGDEFVKVVSFHEEDVSFTITIAER